MAGSCATTSSGAGPPSPSPVGNLCRQGANVRIRLPAKSGPKMRDPSDMRPRAWASMAVRMNDPIRGTGHTAPLQLQIGWPKCLNFEPLIPRRCTQVHLSLIQESCTGWLAPHLCGLFEDRPIAVAKSLHCRVLSHPNAGPGFARSLQRFILYAS